MSKLTQQAMAHAVTELLRTKTLDKITIRDITDACGLTRNTFYYHFHDIYELLGWLFEEKSREIIKRYEADADWEGGLEEALQYLYENRQMMMHIHESISFDLLFRFINDVMYYHAEAILRRESKGQEFSEKAIHITALFYMNAAVGDVLQWVAAGMDRTPEHKAHVYNTMFQGTVKSVLKSAEKAAAIG